MFPANYKHSLSPVSIILTVQRCLDVALNLPALARLNVLAGYGNRKAHSYGASVVIQPVMGDQEHGPSRSFDVSVAVLPVNGSFRRLLQFHSTRVRGLHSSWC